MSAVSLASKSPCNSIFKTWPPQFSGESENVFSVPVVYMRRLLLEPSGELRRHRHGQRQLTGFHLHC